MFLVIDSNDQPVSVGTIVADPLPAGLTAITLTRAQFDGLRDGSLRYEAGQFVIVPPDPQVVVESDLTDKLRARLDAAKADIAEIVGDGTTVGTIDQANADIAAAQAAIAAAQAIIDGTGTNAQKNAARQDKRDAQQDLAIARLTKQHARDSLALNRAVVALTRLVLRADLLDDNAGT